MRKTKTNYQYTLTLNEQHLHVLRLAIKFRKDLYTGDLTCIADLFENVAPKVENQDLGLLRQACQLLTDHYSGSRPLETKRHLPDFQVGENVLTREQADTVEFVLELFFRTLMAQFGDVAMCWGGYGYGTEKYDVNKFRKDFADILEFGKVSNYANGLPSNASFGAGNENFSDLGRVALDLRSVIRHRTSWDDEPKGGFQVNFDKPMHWANENETPVALATMERINEG